MSKFVVLFLLAGLVIGLWLGLSPSTHRQLIRLWDRSSIGQTSSAPTGTSLHQWDRRFNRWLRATARPHTLPQTDRGTVPTGPQISDELQVLWNALHSLWLNFLNRLHLAAA